MTLQICSYQGCYIQRFPCSSITFFQLPIDEPRRTQWILNSGNKQLLNLKISQKRYFCENHFQKTDIKPHFYRKLLYRNAVPVAYLSEAVPTTTTSTTTNEANFTEFDEVEEEFNDAGSAYKSDFCQVNEISEGEFGVDEVEDLNVSQTNSYIINDYDDVEYIEESIMQEESQILKEIIYDEAAVRDLKAINDEIATIVPSEAISVDVNALDTSSVSTVEEAIEDLEVINEITTIVTSEAISMDINALDTSSIRTDEAAIEDSESINEIDTNIPNETVSISVDDLASSSVTAIANTSTITTTASSTTTDAIIEVASRFQSVAAATTALVTNDVKEIQSDLATSDKSYESDKHFALSLVYYFQRLNANKKTKAKIDILTYLVALEQANDA